MTPYQGGCGCGLNRFVAQTEPVLATLCHCRDCQHMTGSAFSANLVVPRAAVHFEAEASTAFEKVADRGHAMTRVFCTTCGSPLYVKNSAFPEVVILAAASLDDPSRFEPEMDIYTASAQPWDRFDPDLPQFTGMPPAIATLL